MLIITQLVNQILFSHNQIVNQPDNKVGRVISRHDIYMVLRHIKTVLNQSRHLVCQNNQGYLGSGKCLGSFWCLWSKVDGP